MIGVVLAIQIALPSVAVHADDADPTRLALELRASTQLERVLADAAVGVHVRSSRHLPLTGVHVIEVDARAARAVAGALKRIPSVLSVRGDHPMTASRKPNDPLFAEQWGTQRVRLPEAWNSSVGSDDIVVAVLDTGVSSHVELDGRVLRGYNMLDGSRSTADDSNDQHGTQVAGVIAAKGDNGAGMAGTCWRCRVLPIKVLDSTGQGWTSDIAEGIRRATEQGADVINMSFGGPWDDTAIAAAVVDARKKGVVLVAAAGNEGLNLPTYPAAYEDVLGVAATDETDQRYVWSNWGSWVSVAAPGCNPATHGTSKYTVFCGTSSAAPMVSGTAALLRARGISPRRTEFFVTRTAGSLGDLDPSRWGRIEASRPYRWRTKGVPLSGDWNGDGIETPGWFKGGRFHLVDRNGRSPSAHSFHFGRAQDVPLVGDWNGDGRDTVGIVRDGEWHLVNGHRGGSSDMSFTYGRVGPRGDDVPLTGDWDGNGREDIGIVRDGEWHLRTTLSGGPGQIVFTYGRIGPRGDDLPLVGDWNGNGKDTVGIVRDGEWHLRNSLSGGPGEVRFTYGRVSRGDLPLAGDWDGDGDDSPVVVRGWNWHLRYQLSGGGADRSFANGG